MAARLARLAALALLLLAAALPARADPFADLVAALASDNFADKEKAIFGLGKLGDARAVPILSGLANDQLSTTKDGKIVLSLTAGGTTKLVDPASGAESTTGCAARSRPRSANSACSAPTGQRASPRPTTP
jgi:HEAT repeat protein